MSAVELFLIGITHRTASLSVRERLALTPMAEAALAAELAAIPDLREFVILNTCNRVEIYGLGQNAGLRHRVMQAFCGHRGVALSEFAQLSLDLTGRAALDHLLEVASGLDSQMLGENEIFGQVKKAFLTAQTRRSVGPVFNRIFQKTFQAAKYVRSNTGITAGLVSVSNVAVELAIRMFGKLSETKVLLLGAGDIGLKSGRAFRSRGPEGLVVASRRLERAQEAAAELDAIAVPFEEALASLGDFDVVICSTSAPAAIITREQAAAAAARRRGRPLFLIDAAMPRDVDAGAAGLRNVFLYNLDDLARIAAENRTAREAEISRCRVMLREKGDGLWAQLDRAAHPVGAPLMGTAAACMA